MPTPISISSSPSSKFGLPAAGDRAGGQRDAHRARTAVHRLTQRLKLGAAHSRLRRGADDLLDDQRARDAAPAGRIGRGLDRDVVVGDHGRAASVGHFGRHFEVHHVALVVLDDEDDAGALIDRFDRRDHLVRRRRSENLPGTGGVQHAEADEPGMQRLVSRAAPRRSAPTLPGVQRSAANELALLAGDDDVGVRRERSRRGFPPAGFEAN